jgi:hypothetical protein
MGSQHLKDLDVKIKRTRSSLGRLSGQGSKIYYFVWEKEI